MKSILLILFLFIFSSCKNIRHIPNYTDDGFARNNGEQFVDSLKLNKINSIIAYYAGCSGCRGSFIPTYYVFWKEQKVWKFAKFIGTDKYINEGYEPPVEYIESVFSKLDTEILKDSNYLVSHHRYDYIRLIVKDNEIKYSIPDFTKIINESSYKVLIIDKIRSSVLDVPIKSK